MKKLPLAIFVVLATPISVISQDASPTSAAKPLSAEDQAFRDSGGHWVTDDTFRGRSKEDLSELMNMALSDDTLAMVEMVGEGRAVFLKQGQRVQLQDASMFSDMARVRLVGETKSWWIYVTHISETPIMTHDEKLSAVQATARLWRRSGNNLRLLSCDHGLLLRCREI
jgi:hypothetical protein